MTVAFSQKSWENYILLKNVQQWLRKCGLNHKCVTWVGSSLSVAVPQAEIWAFTSLPIKAFLKHREDGPYSWCSLSNRQNRPFAYHFLGASGNLTLSKPLPPWPFHLCLHLGPAVNILALMARGDGLPSNLAEFKWEVEDFSSSFPFLPPLSTTWLRFALRLLQLQWLCGFADEKV